MAIQNMKGTHVFRHTLATLAYRANRVLDGAAPEFGDFSAGEGVMTPTAMLDHAGAILSYANLKLTGVKGERVQPADWAESVENFYNQLGALDKAAAEGFSADEDSTMRMFQGPILDALTHVGQLATLRRLSGSPVPPDHYIKAQIEVGRVGQDQAPSAA